MSDFTFDGICVVCGKPLIRWCGTRKEGIHGVCMDKAIEIIIKNSENLSENNSDTKKLRKNHSSEKGVEVGDECWYLHPEGYCVFDKHCNFRDDDMKCTATEEDLITFADSFKFAIRRGKTDSYRGGNK